MTHRHRAHHGPQTPVHITDTVGPTAGALSTHAHERGRLGWGASLGLGPHDGYRRPLNAAIAANRIDARSSPLLRAYVTNAATATSTGTEIMTARASESRMARVRRWPISVARCLLMRAERDASQEYILTDAIDCIASLTVLTRTSVALAVRPSMRCVAFMILIWMGSERTMMTTPMKVGHPMYANRMTM